MMIKYCGIALCALMAILTLRGQKSEFAGFIGLAAAVILLSAAASEFLPTLNFISDTVEGTAFESYLSVLMKALGITLAVQFTAEVCRDAGESALASKLELVGKAQILLLSLPLIEELTLLVSGIVKG